jgi:predicted RNA binding protein YcfA (HicA-like mRNA interferase family)
MTRREKLIARIRARPVEADFDDVRNLLEDFGWSVERERGSHVTFWKEGEALPIAFPKRGGRRVGRVYLDMICRRLGLD